MGEKGHREELHPAPLLWDLPHLDELPGLKVPLCKAENAGAGVERTWVLRDVLVTGTENLQLLLGLAPRGKVFIVQPLGLLLLSPLGEKHLSGYRQETLGQVATDRRPGGRIH